MSGELHFLDIDGQEVANSYRTLSYLSRGLGPFGLSRFEVGRLGCAVLAREVGGMGPFISPALDPAPWYDAAYPESAEFLGVILKVKFQMLKVTRSVSQRFGSVGGGVIGVPQLQARGLDSKSMLIASSCAGLEYGRHWFYGKLGKDCEGCGLYVARVRDSCPPDDGSNDTRGEWIVYDAGLIDGFEDTDDPEGCCDYEEFSFKIAGESPYLYKRASAASAPVTIGATGYLFPVPPTVLDTMVRANTGPPPSASWTGSQFPGMGNTLRILSNVLDNNTHTLATIGAAYWNAATFGPDVAVTVVVPTRVNSGAFELHARIANPTLATATGVIGQVNFGSGGGLDSVLVGRRTGNISTGFQWNLASAVGTYATGDTFALVCRGFLIEMWRKPSGGDWTRLVGAYDPTVTFVGGNVGVAIVENGATQTLGAFGAGTLTNGSVMPVDVNTVVLPNTPIGILAPIITVTAVAPNVPATQVASNGVRMQLKDYASCSETDDFSVNDLATKWFQQATPYTITGGKLKPTATNTVPVTIFRSNDGTSLNAVRYQGGRVEAVVTLGTTLTNGAWGIQMDQAWAGIRQSGNLFALGTTAQAGTVDSVSFTPVASTTYRVILEVLTTSTQGSYDVRAYLVNQAAPNTLVTRPLRGTIVMAGSGPVRSFGISSVPKDTAEAWDSFYAIDYSDSAAFIEADIPGGTLIVDTPRRASQFTPQSDTVSVDGTGYLSTPIDTPLGWPDVCAGDGPLCLQVFGREVAWPGTTFTVATQLRAR